MKLSEKGDLKKTVNKTDETSLGWQHSTMRTSVVEDHGIGENEDGQMGIQEAHEHWTRGKP